MEPQIREEADVREDEILDELTQDPALCGLIVAPQCPSGMRQIHVELD